MHRRKHPLFSFADVSHTQIITRQVFRRLAARQPVVESVRVAELATKPLDLVLGDLFTSTCSTFSELFSSNHRLRSKDK